MNKFKDPVLVKAYESLTASYLIHVRGRPSIKPLNFSGWVSTV